MFIGYEVTRLFYTFYTFCIFFFYTFFIITTRIDNETKLFRNNINLQIMILFFHKVKNTI